MTISSSLNAGVAGLAANAARLATISDNISNSSTYGYKRAETDFESVVLSGAAGSSSYTAGGVRTTSSRVVDERGSLVGTSSALDIAVTGRGFIPVSTDADINGTEPPSLQLVTTGSFRADSNGVLRTPSGQALLAWPADPDGTIPTFPRDTASGLEPVIVNANQAAGDPTTTVRLGVNLPASESVAGASGNTLPLSVEYFGNLGTSETLDITFTPTVPATGASNAWSLIIRDSASNNAIVGQYNVTFDASRNGGGSLASVTQVSGGAYAPATGVISLTVAGGPLALNVGEIGDPEGLTQLSSSFSPVSITKDGSPVGNLSNVEIDNEGNVVASYDTGFIRTLYQIPLVDVPNVNGLTAIDGQSYQVSPDSGSFFLWDAGDGPTSAIANFALEESTTDVAAELTSLIQTQRAYSSNATVIQTVDEMLQETTNLKR